MNFKDVTYAFPEASLLLLVGLLLPWLLLKLFIYRKRALENFASKEVLSRLLIPRSRSLYTYKCILICFSWVFSTFALMQPLGFGSYPRELTNLPEQEQGTTFSLKSRRKAVEIIFLIDASSSMTVPDMRSGKTRLEAATEIADTIIGRMSGENVSLYAFTSSVSQLSPATMDYLFVRLMLRDIQFNEGGVQGTDLTDALNFIRDRYFREKLRGEKAVIILSDGEDTHLESLDEKGLKKAYGTLLSQLDGAAKYQLRVFTIGVGSREGRPVPKITFEGKPVVSALNETLLKSISQKGNGKYYFANDYTELDLASSILNAIEARTATMEEEKTINLSNQEQENLIRALYYQIPLTLAILCLAIAILIPDTRRKAS